MNYNAYTVWLTHDPTYYNCSQADAHRIATAIGELVQEQFPGIEVKEYRNDGHCSLCGPDDDVCAEITAWIEENWTAAL